VPGCLCSKGLRDGHRERSGLLCPRLRRMRPARLPADTRLRSLWPAVCHGAAQCQPGLCERHPGGGLGRSAPGRSGMVTVLVCRWPSVPTSNPALTSFIPMLSRPTRPLGLRALSQRCGGSRSRVRNCRRPAGALRCAFVVVVTGGDLGAQDHQCNATKVARRSSQAIGVGRLWPHQRSLSAMVYRRARSSVRVPRSSPHTGRSCQTSYLGNLRSAFAMTSSGRARSCGP
jgi:hypothetical protein